MGDRQHTIVCIFDPTSPRISAYEIREWIHDHLQVPDHSLTMMQTDGIKRHVFLGFVDDIHGILQTANGQAEYKHVTGENSIVRTEMADKCTRRIRIAKLPP